MGRVKQRMELINNEKTRKTTFQKRKAGLLKKASELKILCDVEVGLIIYGPRLDRRPAELEIWPAETPDDINRLIDAYRKQPSEDRVRKTVDLSNFFQDRKQKIEDDIAKLRKKNEEAKYTKWDDRYNEWSKQELERFETELDRKIVELKERVEVMKGSAAQAVVPYYNSGYYQPEPFYGNSQNLSGYFGYGGVEGVAAAVTNNQNHVMETHYVPSDSNPVYYQHQMERSVGYDPSLALIDQKNSLSLSNNFANLGQFSGLDTKQQQLPAFLQYVQQPRYNGADPQQFSGVWQLVHPRIGLPRVYDTNNPDQC